MKCRKDRINLMSKILRSVAPLLLLVVFWTGWFAYPGWYCEWYSNTPEKYAYPASMSNQFDPKWGFWFW